MADNLPTARSATSPHEREHIHRIIGERGLCGLANDTKWDELISAIRELEPPRPRYRFKCVDGVPSDWDAEWFYHLPFPFMSVEWFDISYRTAATDHSAWLFTLLVRIGFDYHRGTDAVRIFGYSPKTFDSFTQ